MPERPVPVRFSRGSILLLLFILLCGIALRIADLPHEALEADEVFSRCVVLLSPSHEIIAIRDDLVHPPLYYFLLQATTWLWGASPLGIRIFSLLCGIGSIGLIALIGNTLPDGYRTGLLAAALLAINRSQIFYSQEARSYSWYVFLVLLLVLWVWRVTRLTGSPPSLRHWALGTLLMAVIFYTHYIGAIYVGAAVLAILVCRLPASRRLATLACASIATLSFVPWLIVMSTVYKEKGGLQSNLYWMERPNAENLKQVFTSALGILEIRLGDRLDLLLITALILAVLLFNRHRPLRQSPVVLALLFLSFLPPLAIFFLSRRPFDQPIFELRHFLPSIPAIILLCCYGVDRLAQAARTRSTLVFSAGALLLLTITAIPTLQRLIGAPERMPYDLASREVEKYRDTGIAAYTVASFTIGLPVNFYCSTNCVTPLPSNDLLLPTQFVLLWQPGNPLDRQQYQQLQNDGYSEVAKRYFTNGVNSSAGTNVTLLRRRSTAPNISAVADKTGVEFPMFNSRSGRN